MEGLPDYDPDGRPWTWEARLLWKLVWLQEWAAVRVSRSLGDKRAKLSEEKQRPFPWSPRQGGVTEVYGDRGNLTNEEAKRILDNL